MDRWGDGVQHCIQDSDKTDLQLSLFVAKSSERIIKLTVELQYRPHIFHIVQYNRYTQHNDDHFTQLRHYQSTTMTTSGDNEKTQ